MSDYLAPGDEVILTLGGESIQATVHEIWPAATILFWIRNGEVIQQAINADTARIAIKKLDATPVPAPAEDDAVEVERQRYYDACSAQGVDPGEHEDEVLGSIDSQKEVGDVVWVQMNRVFDGEPVNNPAYYAFMTKELEAMANAERERAEANAALDAQVDRDFDFDTDAPK